MENYSRDLPNLDDLAQWGDSENYHIQYLHPETQSVWRWHWEDLDYRTIEAAREDLKMYREKQSDYQFRIIHQVWNGTGYDLDRIEKD